MSEEYLPEEYINPDEYLGDLLPDFSSLIKDDNAPIGHQLKDIVSTFVWFPNDEAYKIVATYMMLSQKWCKVIPIMFCYGLPGSGKSTVSILTAYLHNQSYTFSSSDTFPSIRNSLDRMRWLDENKDYERDGAILCWDNLGTADLNRDPRLLQLMLYGYNRSTDKIQIANNDGTNKVFHVFCPKVISSIEPLHIDPSFQELARRLMVIFHKKVPENTNISLESLNDYDFSSFPKMYFDFWHNKENCIKYVSFRRHFSTTKKWELPDTIKTITIDMAATYALAFEASTDETITLFHDYWEHIMATNQKSELEESLEIFMDIEFKKLGNAKQPYVRHSVIKEHLALLLKDGVITTTEAKDFKLILRKLGYISNKFGWFQSEVI